LIVIERHGKGRRPSTIPQKEISTALKNVVLGSERPMYKIAALAGIAPAILSKAINGREKYFLDDPRIKRIAKVVKFKGDCFSN